MHLSELTKERRQLYRLTLGEENQVEVAFWTDSGDGLVGEVVDVSAKGVAIRVSRSDSPVLSLGESVAFPFTPQAQSDPVALKATLRSRNPLGGYWRYGFEFQLKNMINMRFAEEFYGLFNRRNAFRVRPTPKEPIAVTITEISPPLRQPLPLTSKMFLQQGSVSSTRRTVTQTFQMMSFCVQLYGRRPARVRLI